MRSTSLMALGLAVASLSFGCSSESVCQVNGDCLNGGFCLGGSCVPATERCAGKPACAAATDCESALCEAGCCLERCEGDANCPTDQECVQHACRPAAVVSCHAPGDCAARPHAPVCDLTAGTCVRCTENRHCAAGESCTDRRCTSPDVDCTSDTGCASNLQLPHCLPAEGRCVACNADAQCSSDGSRLCDPVAHACRVAGPDGCGWDGDCDTPSKPRCRDDRSCVECLLNADCPSGQRCLSDNTCAPATTCASASDCASPNPQCRTPDKVCVECLVSSHCGPGRKCLSNACVPEVNGCVSDSHCSGSLKKCLASERTCVACLATPDCPAGGVCEQNQCAGCLTDANCAAVAGRPKCDGARQCVACREETDCSPGQACSGGVCGGCQSDANCARLSGKPHCVAGGQCVACLADAECSGDQRCQSGACADVSCVSGVCPAGRTCVADSAAGICRLSCELYAAVNTCAGGNRCGVASFSGAIPKGACLAPRAAAKQAGELCSSTARCDVDLLCVRDSATGSHCHRFCDPVTPAGACTTPDLCQPVAVMDGENRPKSVGACHPDSSLNDPCGSSAACDAGQSCGPGPEPTAPANLRNLCDWNVGTKRGGTGCSTGADCLSGWCLPSAPRSQVGTGFCDEGCDADAQCPGRTGGIAGACSNYALDWIDANGAATRVSLPTCVAQCDGDLDCGYSDTCTVFPNSAGTKWTTRCQPHVNPAGGLGGSVCEASADCLSGSCLKYTGVAWGLCQAGCSSDDDCETDTECDPNGVVRRVGAGPDGIASNADDVFAPAPICWGAACTWDGACYTDEVCGADTHPLNARDVVTRCRPARGTRRGGVLCTDSAECRSGHCLTWASGSARCFGACIDNSDCGGGRCSRQVWTATTPNHTQGFCVPP